MTSAINPNNINGAYPVAGQDNDSQGFRDNFTNTKTNFQYASAEITDLQNKAVLKSALTGGILNNNMNGSLLTNAQFTNITAPKEALGTVTSADIDYTVSSYYTLTAGGNVTLSFSNLPNPGELATWRVQITISNISYSVTLPSSVSVGTNNLQGYINNVITFSQTGIYEFEFETSDGGSTISIFDLNRNRDPIYLPSYEDLADGDGADLSVTTSLFSTTTASTATLAAGSEGQIKIFAMEVDGGNMVITVTNAGWKSSGTGTITFNDIGDGCTLQYIGGKWFCVGNNGVTFG
jgi:hypothetical protein